MNLAILTTALALCTAHVTPTVSKHDCATFRSLWNARIVSDTEAVCGRSVCPEYPNEKIVAEAIKELSR